MKKILFISALLISINSNAQNIDNMCGTDVPENYFELLEEKRDLIEKYEKEYSNTEKYNGRFKKTKCYLINK